MEQNEALRVNPGDYVDFRRRRFRVDSRAVRQASGNQFTTVVFQLRDAETGGTTSADCSEVTLLERRAVPPSPKADPPGRKGKPSSS
jgi:hypothetical protein